MKQAKFNVGHVVYHTQQGYRAVVVDIDPIFQASGRMNPRAMSKAFALRNPWYRLLVDDSSQMTYVEECHLRLAPDQEAINNPMVREHLQFSRQRGYVTQQKIH